MIFTETKLKGAYIIEPEKKADLNPRLVQCNISYNARRSTLRGMHHQAAPYAEAKLVRCTRGVIHDVIIDLRPDSATYKQHVAVVLSADNYRMLYIPEGFAHGFQTLEDDSEVLYQMSEFYMSEMACGVRWNDPVFSIEWPETQGRIISDKDNNWAPFRVDG